MDRHCANAQKVAEFLDQHAGVEWVSYAGLASSPYYAVAQKYLRYAGSVPQGLLAVNVGHESRRPRCKACMGGADPLWWLQRSKQCISIITL